MIHALCKSRKWGSATVSVLKECVTTNLFTSKENLNKRQILIKFVELIRKGLELKTQTDCVPRKNSREFIVKIIQFYLVR